MNIKVQSNIVPKKKKKVQSNKDCHIINTLVTSVKRT